MKRIYIAPFIFVAILLPHVSNGMQIGVALLAGNTDHRQYRETMRISLFFYKALSPKLSTVLELSHRRYENIYFGEKVSQNITTSISPETVNSQSFSHSATIWIRSNVISLGNSVIAVGAGAGPIALDGKITGQSTNNEVSYRKITKISGNIAIGVESLISRSPSIF
ncbi:MAG: hypothetical protein CMG71_01555 [Candidatus Marinimicrobia bacterium]|nr:hypothetical protein [Candidatus Neomarinimicrobiota bacterium]